MLYVVWSFTSLCYCNNISSANYMKPTVVCQPLSKFGMFTFVDSHAMPFIVFFS